MSALVIAILPLIGVALGSWLTHYLTRSRFREEKIWQIRQTVYSQLLYEMRNAQIAAHLLASRLYTGTATEEQKTSIKDHYHKHANNMAESFYQNHLIMSADVGHRYEVLERDMLSQEIIFGDDYLRYSDLAKLLASAYKDLLPMCRDEMEHGRVTEANRWAWLRVAEKVRKGR